jgi:hypothetical protein
MLRVSFSSSPSVGNCAKKKSCGHCLMGKKCSFSFVIRDQMDAIPQLQEMSETLRDTSNKRNAGF